MLPLYNNRGLRVNGLFKARAFFQYKVGCSRTPSIKAAEERNDEKQQQIIIICIKMKYFLVYQ
jgi:hypothetical protein